MFIRNRFPFFLLLLILVGFGVRTAVAQTDTGLTMNVRAGFDGLYKPGSWVPVQVTVANSGPAVEGELRITLGSAFSGDEVVYNAPISLPTQSNKQVTLYVYLPQFTSELAVELLADNGSSLLTVPSNKLTQLGTNGILYGVVTSTPGDLDFLQDVTGSRLEAAVAYLTLNDLPELPPAWNGLDVVIFHDVDTAQLSPAQLAALSAWVETGGQVVVAGGPGWQKTAVSFADTLPVTISGSESQADLPALSDFAGMPFRDPGPYLVITSSLRNGELLIHQAGLPLLARQAQGQGAVYFLALDPSLAPLVDWDGGPALWQEVAARVALPSPWAAGVRNAYAANTAVSSLPALALPSVLQLILYLLIYVVVIGPVNYIVLKRRNRRELAWITIPVTVLIFSAIAYLTGFQLKGNDTIINEMSVAVGALDSGQMRVQSLLGLYSPRRQTYNVRLPTEAAARPLLNGYGDSPDLYAITRSGDLTLTDVRVDVSGVAAFLADTVQPALPLDGEAALRTQDGRVELAATIRNESDLTLENATLLVGSTAVALGNIAPGAEVSQTALVSPAAASSVTGLPAFSYGPGGGSPLLMNAETILGTSDYYNDRIAFPRWQLLQALEEEFATGTGAPVPAVTLAAWSTEPQIEAALVNGENGRAATTLYLIDVPLDRQLSAGQITVPASLLHWEILADNGLYSPAIQNFYLPPAVWMEVAYRPWPELAGLAVTGLSVQLEESYASGSPAPAVAAWDWQAESWVVLSDVNWGITAVSAPQRFIGENNSVRLRLENNRTDEMNIGGMFPVLVGELSR